MKRGIRAWAATAALLGVLLLGGGAVLGGCSRNAAGQEPAAGAAAAAPAVQESTVAASGPVVDARVVPAVRADLSFPIGGIVAAVAVREGDVVEQGQVLVQLDAAEQRTAVSRAEADFRRAQARLAQVEAGARTEELAAAEAAVAAAEARLARVRNAALPGEVAAAEANLAGAQAALQKLLEGASEQELIQARADAANAEAALQQAQAAYDLVKWRNDVGALPQSAALQQATNQLTAAQARLADLETGPSQADLARARADVDQARAQLEQVRAALPADVAAADADVRQAQAQLDLLRAGPSAEEVAVAEAEVAAATAALQQALVALAQTELRAPFGGTVALLDVNAGEQVAAGTQVIRLADLSQWEVRTEDLTELEIAGVTPGDDVVVTFDALPDLELPGVVERIRPIGTDQRGDIVYTVVVRPEGQDNRILWNMTAVVTFP